jgi:hypothetical protein
MRRFTLVNSEAEDEPFPYNLNSKAIFFILSKFSSEFTGVKVKDRTYHFKKYPKCFVAKEAVDFLKSEFPELSECNRKELTKLLEVFRKIGSLEFPY